MRFLQICILRRLRPTVVPSTAGHKRSLTCYGVSHFLDEALGIPPPGLLQASSVPYSTFIQAPSIPSDLQQSLSALTRIAATFSPLTRIAAVSEHPTSSRPEYPPSNLQQAWSVPPLVIQAVKADLRCSQMHFENRPMQIQVSL